MKQVLKIYVAEHCLGCEEACDTAFRIEQDYPHLTVQVIDVEKNKEAIPEEVFATPTYILNNRIVSLGNPGPTDIARWMQNL